MTTSPRWTSRDLELFPDNGKRYEIIAGDLYVSKQPNYWHQFACGRVFSRLDTWNNHTGAGFPNIAPGIVFAEDDDVAPDVTWISKKRLASVLGVDGKLHAAPELVVEVLSPGSANERRDRDIKLRLYSRRGVREYWILDWRRRRIEIYRRKRARLHIHATLVEEDTLSSPLLPGFSCSVSALFEGFPPVGEQESDLD